jgi:protein SCO1/2/putative membrane protein
MQIAKCKLPRMDHRVAIAASSDCNLQFAICNLQFAISSLRLQATIFSVAIICLIGCVSSARAATPDDDYGSVADFSLTERSRQVIQRQDLAGKVWVAAFIFTRCAGPCALISSSMSSLQRDLAGAKDVRLVSFTVDPEFDNSEVLRAYAERFGADPERWLFLTGKRDELYGLIRNSFLLGVERALEPNPQPGYEVAHSTKLVLVDPRGHIRGYFDGTDSTELSELKRRITFLVWQNRLPAVNATLNGLCALVLSLGYLAIRRRRIALHKACMLAALGISALFLTCYLYYHLVVRNGEPTPFTRTGWVRPVYFAVLVSHTLLAAAVAPLALFTAYQGLRDRLSRHVSVARWTLPLWLYVSVTGVVVYCMLYHLYPSP